LVDFNIKVNAILRGSLVFFSLRIKTPITAISSFFMIGFISAISITSKSFNAKPLSSGYLPPIKYERASSEVFRKTTSLVSVGLNKTNSSLKR